MMYLKNEEFDAIEKALSLLPHGEAFKELSAEQQSIIVKADTVMVGLLKKRKENNRRVSAYIAGKRKTDKNYARKKG